jgi:hypothetical protein
MQGPIRYRYAGLTNSAPMLRLLFLALAVVKVQLF